MCVADAANWGNIELAGTNPTYRPLPHRCESHKTSHSRCFVLANGSDALQLDYYCQLSTAIASVVRGGPKSKFFLSLQ